MEQLLLHLFGDFIVQNDWMALNKKKNGLIGFLTCSIHCISYSLPFFLITNWMGVLLICISHFALDRTYVTEKFLKLRNGVKNTSNFGFKKERPFEITFWLMVITDNVIHLICNYFIITYL